MCVISALEAKRLLHKGCEVYLAHVIDTSTLKETLESVPIVREFSDMLPEDLLGFPPDNWNLALIFCSDQLSFLYHRIAWP